MLDINLFREEKGGDPERVRESQRRRYADVALVDKVVEFDKKWRSREHFKLLYTTKPVFLDVVQFETEQLKREFNALNKQIGQLRKAKEDATELQEKSKEMKKQIQDAEAAAVEAESERDNCLKLIGNLVHDSVPVSDLEEENAVVRTFGEAKHDPDVHKKIHFDLIYELNIVNLEAASKVAGSRAYYLINEGVLLNQALINFALQFGRQRGYHLVHTPFFMTKEVMAECAQLEQFDEELYKVSGEGEDKYLIATSEQTLCAMHRKKWFEPDELPVKQCGYSTCFRKEAGSRGRDTLGIFRVHQFEKVEQFVVCSPEDNHSWECLEDMLKNAEDFYQALGIPYRVVTIVSGDLNNAAAKKYDLEAWFPASQAFRELVSCSNCTDYQARRLDARLRTPKQEGAAQEKKYVHMLNSTITATERTICCILENYQTDEGVVVPEVLRPFMGGLELIPYSAESKAPPN